MTKDLGTLTAREVVENLKSGSLSANDYVDSIAQSVSHNENLNAVQSFDAAHLSRSIQTALSDYAGAALAGLPIIAKDNFNTTAFPTTGGTGALMNRTPATNAKVVDQIKQAGGVIGAKGGMHELAFGITSNNAVTGAIKNPHDQTMIAGGSSGGTASAIAAGIFPLGLGTDTGDSCRIPASLCGTVGYRPTTGRYASSGIIPISSTLDAVGSLARNVDDILMLDDVLTGQKIDLRPDLLGVRIGVPRARFFDDIDTETSAAVERTLRTLEAAGVTLIDVSLENIWEHAGAFSIPVALFEVIRELLEYLAAHAPDVSFEDLVSKIGSPDVAGLFQSQLGGDAIPASMYDHAMKIHRPAMLDIYNAVFADNQLDAIAFPTTPITARPIGHDETVDLNGEQVPTFPTYIRNTDLAPNIGAPGISLPCQNVDGLPVGIEFDGLPGKDDALLALARTAEATMSR